MAVPTTNGIERDARGKFLPGNSGGAGGNPHAARVCKLKKAMLEAVTEDDIHMAMRKLVDLAGEGNVYAIRELLDRTVGKPTSMDDEAAATAMGIVMNLIAKGNN